MAREFYYTTSDGSYDPIRVTEAFVSKYAAGAPHASIRHFQKIIYAYYVKHNRSFSWRGIRDPYKILVSEIMLQQTQTSRVIQKYSEFITKYPTITALANSTLKELLGVWQGLGYNRRARYLQMAAVQVCEKHAGIIPVDYAELLSLPGIGPATAGAICVYAYHQPHVYIETNVRTVFLHFFFYDRQDIMDKELLSLVELAIDKNDPARWYSALMDYGVMLKKNFTNPSRKSKHHTRQSTFVGSRRQLRGMIVRLLLDTVLVSAQQIAVETGRDVTEILSVLSDMMSEGLIVKKSSGFSLV